MAGGNATTRVFAFGGADYATKTYTGLSATPDANGKYSFNLPAGSYWFGVLKDGVYTIEDQNQTMIVPQTTAHAIVASDTATFTYDALSRLTNATYNDGRNFQYGYDATGNRVQQVAGNGFVAPVTTNYTFDPANRLTSDGTKTYAWDANGNMTGDGSRTFTFDSANQMRQLVIGANTYAYGYDGNGNRLSSAVNGGTAIHFQNDNAGLSQVLSDGSNLYIPGLVQSNADGTNAQYFLQDALGSNVMLADATANWTVLPQYDPFGQSAPTSLTKFGYTGEQKDASGLEFLRARYYDQDLGQFISKDPESGSSSDPISMNGYAYGSQNPINRTDPSGRCDGDLLPNGDPLDPFYYINGALFTYSCINDVAEASPLYNQWKKDYPELNWNPVADGYGSDGFAQYNRIMAVGTGLDQTMVNAEQGLAQYNKTNSDPFLPNLSPVDRAVAIFKFNAQSAVVGSAVIMTIISAIEPCDIGVTTGTSKEISSIDMIKKLSKMEYATLDELAPVIREAEENGWSFRGWDSYLNREVPPSPVEQFIWRHLDESEFRLKNGDPRFTQRADNPSVDVRYLGSDHLFQLRTQQIVHDPLTPEIDAIASKPFPQNNVFNRFVSYYNDSMVDKGANEAHIPMIGTWADVMARYFNGVIAKNFP